MKNFDYQGQTKTNARTLIRAIITVMPDREELAKRLGVCESAVDNWEHGKVEPQSRNYRRLHALAVDLGLTDGAETNVTAMELTAGEVAFGSKEQHAEIRKMLRTLKKAHGGKACKAARTLCVTPPTVYKMFDGKTEMRLTTYRTLKGWYLARNNK